MTPEQWESVRELFHAALDLPPEKRPEFLKAKCSEAGIRAEVESLLSAAGNSVGPIDKPALEHARKAIDVALASDPNLPLLIGRTLGQYEIVALLGVGGMGEVYRARDRRLKRDVALKVLPGAFASDPERMARFQREAEVLASLNHPNIAQIYGIEDTALVMEFIDGTPPRGPLAPAEAVRMALGIAAALEAAHDKGITHRDLKPANILVTQSGVKLLDFGLALVDERAGVGIADAVTALTAPGAVMGTVAYMSPEQARGKPADARSDLWSLGVVLYEVATGARPFEGPTNAVVFDAILNQGPIPVRKRNPEVPADLERIIARLLEKDVTRRYQSAAELRADLKRFDSGFITTSAPARVRPVVMYGIAAALTTVAAGGFFVHQRAQPSPLADKDVLVLADFANNTGDPIFNTTLREALAVQLEQSPFLKIMGDEQVREDLKLMGRSPDEHITNQLAREICQREGDKAMIAGMIAGFGNSYPITLEATNCRTGEPLAREQVQAAGKDRVLQAISTAVSGMRRRLGESLASIRKLDRPLDKVTTRSLEAFQTYSLGMEQVNRGNYREATPFFQRATELDPNFGSAWNQLGVSLGNAQMEERLAREASTRAFALRDRVSERERFEISGEYYLLNVRDFGKAADAFDLWSRAYPRDAGPHIELGFIHLSLGQLEEGLKEDEEAYRLEPRNSLEANNLFVAFRILSRFDDAKAVADRAFAQHVDSFEIHSDLLMIALEKDNPADEAKEIRWFADRQGEAVSLVFQALRAGRHGQLRRSRELSKRAEERARQIDKTGRLDFLSLPRPLLVLGANCPAVQSLGAAAVLLCTDVEGPLKAAEDEAEKYPADPTVNEIQLPTLRAQVELKRNNATKAIDLLQSVLPYERASNAAFYRGLAYLQLHKPTEAGIEFQKLLDNPGNYWEGPEYPLAFLGRARAAALSGDTAKATKVYQGFFAYWKDADPDLPVLIEARKEYAALPRRGP